ncbi:MAG: hypothetical protein AAFU79_36430, partial [Myxococcota bacterium]
MQHQDWSTVNVGRSSRPYSKPQTEAEKKAAARKRREEAKARKEIAERVLGITPATKQRIKAADKMTEREMVAEFERLSKLTRAEVEKIAMGNHRPPSNYQTFGLVNVVTTFVGGNVSGMVSRYPKVWKAITNLPLKDSPPLYRGMVLGPDARRLIREGHEFDMREASSWSKNREQSEGFAFGETSAIRPGEESFVFRMDAPERGADISGFSQLGMEEEVVLSGKVRITGLRKVKNAEGRPYTLVEVEQVSTAKKAAPPEAKPRPANLTRVYSFDAEGRKPRTVTERRITVDRRKKPPAILAKATDEDIADLLGAPDGAMVTVDGASLSAYVLKDGAITWSA